MRAKINADFVNKISRERLYDICIHLNYVNN